MSTIKELERQIQIKTDVLEISNSTALQARIERFILRLQLKEQARIQDSN